MASNGKQWQTVASSGKQWHSEAASNGKQWHSEASSGTQRQAMASSGTRGNRWPFGSHRRRRRIEAGWSLRAWRCGVSARWEPGRPPPPASSAAPRSRAHAYRERSPSRSRQIQKADRLPGSLCGVSRPGVRGRRRQPWTSSSTRCRTCAGPRASGGHHARQKCRSAQAPGRQAGRSMISGHQRQRTEGGTGRQRTSERGSQKAVRGSPWQLHSDALRRTQTHSDALRSTQKHSEALRSTQKHSEALRSAPCGSGQPQTRRA